MESIQVERERSHVTATATEACNFVVVLEATQFAESADSQPFCTHYETVCALTSFTNFSGKNEESRQS